MSRFTLLLSISAMALASVHSGFAQAVPPLQPAPVIVPATPAQEGLVFDAESKEYKAKPGEATAPFTFNVTNVSQQPIDITALQPSCGCTAAQLPTMPYKLGAGSNVAISVSMDLRGKPSGLTTKSLGVQSSAGFKSVLLRVDIPVATPVVAPAGTPTVAANNNSMGDRAKNIQLALNDRQAVFKGDCRTCHVDKGVAKLGKELYDADCGVCHDSPHRAAMVPDLKVPRTARDLAYWTTWIKDGKPGTMMPAFGTEHGGPLTKEQVDSLSAYLLEALPKTPAQQAQVPAAAQPTVATPAPQKN